MSTQYRRLMFSLLSSLRPWGKFAEIRKCFFRPFIWWRSVGRACGHDIGSDDGNECARTPNKSTQITSVYIILSGILLLYTLLCRLLFYVCSFVTLSATTASTKRANKLSQRRHRSRWSLRIYIDWNRGKIKTIHIINKQTPDTFNLYASCTRLHAARTPDRSTCKVVVIHTRVRKYTMLSERRCIIICIIASYVVGTVLSSSSS